VLDLALAQLPEAVRDGRILVRTDGAGFSHAWVEHLTEAGLEYSTGFGGHRAGPVRDRRGPGLGVDPGDRPSRRPA